MATKKRARYLVVSEGHYLVSITKALQGAGYEGGAFTRDPSEAKSYPSRPEAVRVAMKILRGVVYRVDNRHVLTTKEILVGDILSNRYVGECRVQKVGPTWLQVSYEGYHFASKSNQRFERIDPVGVGDDGTPNFIRPRKTARAA